jgi:N-acetyl sugar amidotransferase
MMTLYGLPEKVIFCARCVISNQRPNSAIEYQHTASSKKSTIHFDADGICDACRVAEQKQQIDWIKRELDLAEICDRHRSKTGKYDCLVPGSGGKDSFYQAHVLKYKYGMHPLTVTWAPHVYTDWGWKNHQSWIGAGFDNILVTPNARVHRLLTRLAVQNLFHPFQAFMLGQKFLGPRLAMRYDIPLVFYGENEAEYGNPIADTSSAMRSPDYFISNEPDRVHLGGVSVHDLRNRYGLNDGDLDLYMPMMAEPSRDLCVRYLGYYLKWRPQDAYYYAVEHGGFQASPERTPGTYTKFNSIDDKIDDLHYYTTYVKFGIGRATYDACADIRNGEITRDEGVALVKRFDGEYPLRFSDEMMRYLSIPEKEFPVASKQFADPILTTDMFIAMAERFKSPHLWDGQKLRNAVWEK